MYGGTGYVCSRLHGPNSIILILFSPEHPTAVYLTYIREYVMPLAVVGNSFTASFDRMIVIDYAEAADGQPWMKRL